MLGDLDGLTLTDGETLELTEGLLEGEMDGDTEGEIDGLALTEGETDGLMLGLTDAEIDGLSEGETEGDKDALILGEAEELILGEELGLTELLIDGDIEGLIDTDGEADGETEYRPVVQETKLSIVTPTSVLSQLFQCIPE
jgi:hypothetical protein